MSAMYYLGVDVGSKSCDAVLVGDEGQVIAWTVVPTGARNTEAIARARGEVMRAAGLAPEAITATVATGYGRDRVEGRTSSVTEISCHARGVRAVMSGVDVLVDIGGQDSKAVRLDAGGAVVNFAMNDKCAAGTGRFLEAMARTLEVDVGMLGHLDAASGREVSISSMCTVFAESEVVSLIADGAAVPDIVRGLHRAIASRTQVLIRRVAPDVARLRVAMSGGVARNPGVVRALGEALGCPVHVAPEPDTVGALGAALIARERARAAAP